MLLALQIRHCSGLPLTHKIDQLRIGLITLSVFLCTCLPAIPFQSLFYSHKICLSNISYPGYIENMQLLETCCPFLFDPSNSNCVLSGRFLHLRTIEKLKVYLIQGLGDLLLSLLLLITVSHCVGVSQSASSRLQLVQHATARRKSIRAPAGLPLLASN